MTATLKDALVKPKVETARRVLDIFLLPDGSGSMEGLKIATANQAIRESITELKNEAKQHPEVEFRMRCIAFSSNARWHIGPQPEELEESAWSDLVASGCTATGAAVQMLADAVRVENMPEHGLPPVMVLISDGANTDGNAYENALASLEREPWAAKAIRLSIGIGSAYDRGQLEKFTNRPDIGVLEAKNAVDLANYIRYATVTAAKASSQNSTNAGKLANNVALPAPPAPANSNINLQVF